MGQEGVIAGPSRSTGASDGALRGLARSLRPASTRLALAVAAYLVKDSPVWVLPVITSAVIDTVVSGGPASRLVLLGITAIVLVGLNYPVSQIYVRCYMAAVRDLGVDMRNRLAFRLQELSIGYHSRSSSSVVQTKVVRDVENVELMLQQGANPLLSAVGVMGGALVVIAVQLPVFLLLFLLVVPVVVVPVRVMKRRSEERNSRFRRDVEQFSSEVGEMASLLPITRAHGLETVATERVVASARSVRDSGLTLDRLNGQFTAAAWVVFQLLSIMCLIGAALVSVSGLLPISAGQVVLLSTYFVMVTNSVVSLLNLAPLVTKGRESLHSMAELLTEPDVERNQGKGVPAEVRGRLRFEHVDFAYDSGAPLAVDGLDLDVAEGETVAFVGPSGSGKSTVLNLALGFLRPTGGRLLLDDVDLDTLDLRAVRAHVSVVPQESVLFTGSIRDNVTYGMPGTGDDLVLHALREANALEMVRALPDGLNTMLGERGARLSGGQRQRISIARALVRDPRILLLDEATSALDGRSEQLVQGALAALRRGRTTLVVAHRLSTIRSADRIVVLEGGRVVEVGNHDELLARGGVYAAMQALQRT